MRLQPAFCKLCVIVALMAVPSAALAQQPNGTLTVWLIPLELADVTTKITVDEFNQQFGINNPVTVLNTTTEPHKGQLLAWNQELNVPNFAMINGQRETLMALRRFALNHNVHINVLFVWWGRAFDELVRYKQSGTDKDSADRREFPDVAQIGSTWVAYFAERKALLPQTPKNDELDWREIPNVARATLRYTLDVRLIFYWKKMSARDDTFVMDNGSWQSIAESLRRRIAEQQQSLNPPFAFPIGLSQNLEHDYFPLLWSAGCEFLKPNENYVDLTSDSALAIPRLLANNVTVKDDKKFPHRLFVFPEISHEEATSHFWDGEYIAVIEPVSFIKRWHESFWRNGLPKGYHSDQKKIPVPPSESFWDYAGIATPPITFKGGSDLLIMNGTGEGELAFALARFLATDEEYTRTLAGLGQLPAQHENYGIDILFASLDGQSGASTVPIYHPEARRIVGTLMEGQVKWREYPSLPQWPTVFESSDVLESLQRLWRRTAEGKGKDSGSNQLEQTATEVELIINRRINKITWFKEEIRRLSWYIIATSLLIIAAIVFRYVREKARMLDHIRKVRGFASAALLIVYQAHIRGNKYRRADEKSREKAEKALALITGLQGWRRARDDRNWLETSLEKIIWNAIILAIESTYKAHVFKKWEEEGQPDPQAFLMGNELIRSEQALSDDCYPFHFNVWGAAGKKVLMPIMLEQAVVCLLQNAIKASRDKKGYRSITISYEEASDTVYVLNEGPPLDAEMCAVLNGSKDFDEFERRIDELLLSPADRKPGIGLVEAYSIATQCYGGMIVDRHLPKVSIRLGKA
jgi:ABC-type glycerol-3-phosphate transport system substrate-binding protein